MRNIVLILSLTIGVQFILLAQNKNNNLSFSIGLGYDDGITSLNKNPTIGLNYERNINKRISVTASVLSYYQNFSDSYFNSSNKTYPIIDKYRGSESPFLTESDVKKLNESGLKQLHAGQIIKRFSLPIGVGISFYPIVKKNYRIGLNWSFCMTYETRNYWHDYTPMTLTQSNGSKQKIFFPTSTEYRDFSPGFAGKLQYEYFLNHISLGYRISAYNIFLLNLFGAPNSSLWEQSILCTYKF